MKEPPLSDVHKSTVRDADMTPVEKFNAIRRDVIDMLILAMCGVAFYVSYQDRNSPAQSNTCTETSAEVFAAGEISQGDADVENKNGKPKPPIHILTSYTSIQHSPIPEHTVVKSPVS